MIKILFVCLGNICRSPMAEGIFKKMVKDAGLEDLFIVESRATSTWEIGNPPHKGTQKILDRLGVDYSMMRSTQIQADDYTFYDYIIGMDYENIDYLEKHAGIDKDKIHMMRDIDPNTKGEIVPDPYFTGNHEQTYALLDASLRLWLDKCIRDLNRLKMNKD